MQTKLLVELHILFAIGVEASVVLSVVNALNVVASLPEPTKALLGAESKVGNAVVHLF